MKPEKFKPKIDKLFWIILGICAFVLLPLTILPAIFEPIVLLYTIPIDILIAYFIVTPLFGYVELREETLFIKFGFFLKREIPYKNIRGISKENAFYSDSMLSLKNSFEHLNVKYNRFDMVTISVTDNDSFLNKLSALIN